MIRKGIKISLISGIVLLLLIFSWLTYEFNAHPTGPQTKLRFEIKPGESAAVVARNLKKEELIGKTWPFLTAYKLFYTQHSLKAGEYIISKPASPKDILLTFIQGKTILYAVTIPEGLTRLEIAEHLSREYSTPINSYLAATASPALIADWDTAAQDLEGYLFPETYHFPKKTSAPQIAAAMVGQFRKIFTPEWQARAAELEMSIREIVILASLIEKETSRPEERELVSAVFHNRMRLGMNLDCDPTIVYVLKQAGKFKDRLRSKDLKLDSPYNTYLYRGFPPGPIANPGLAAMEAALYPAANDYLFFVSKNNGSHFFSRSYREHINAVNKFQRKK